MTTMSKEDVLKTLRAFHDAQRDTANKLERHLIDGSQIRATEPLLRATLPDPLLQEVVRRQFLAVEQSIVHRGEELKSARELEAFLAERIECLEAEGVKVPT